MKVVAALSAVAALAFAPLALGQQCGTGTNVPMLNSLSVMQKVHKTTVNGGKMLKQMIAVKNTAATPATGIAVRTGTLADLVFHKAQSKPRATYTAANSVVTSTSITLEAGQTLKVSLSYKAANCPTTTGTQSLPVQIFVPNDNNAACFVSGAPASITINKKKTCP